MNSTTLRALDYGVENHRIGAKNERRVERGLTVYSTAKRDPVKRLGDKGGEEENWQNYLTKSMTQGKYPL